jgi:Ca2+-binding EF-hand superfamily protein
MKLIQWVVISMFLTVSTVGVAREQGKTMGQGSPGMQSKTQQMHQTEMQQMKQLQYRNIDSNGDGKITREEVQAHEQLATQMRKQWKTADKNKDGEVDKAEFAAFREQVEQQLEEQHETQQTGEPSD